MIIIIRFVPIIAALRHPEIGQYKVSKADNSGIFQALMRSGLARSPHSLGHFATSAPPHRHSAI
jgi:hypothetical protein